MINFKMKTSSFLAILTLAVLPFSAIAQETVPVVEAVPIQIISASETPSDTTSPQDGSGSSQETLPSESLEGSVNPQDQEVPPVEDVAPDPSVETLDVPVDEVAEIPEEVLEPTKEYTFDLVGDGIPTNESPEWQIGVASTDRITEIPEVDVSTEHVLEVSGECTDPYYVILLYKNQGDYDQNPASYIFNKAYRCIDGQYHYALSELPFNLQSGTFYLLVAGQGEKGSWKPITALIPVGITVKTVFPEVNQNNENAPE
jgi:hypothetical protein